MKLIVVGCVLMLMVGQMMADSTFNTTETSDQEEEEYEDIAVAESQDIAHRRIYQSGDEQAEQRVRPRGRKRRRRLRKRPRSTTPSFLEEYDPERPVKEEEVPLVEEEVSYQRRRPTKRRRRPMRRKPEYDGENPERLNPEVAQEPQEENPPEEYYRPRNTQRRRRKGGRKRIRVSTEQSIELNNSTQEETFAVTTEPSEVVMQSNIYFPEREASKEVSSSQIQDETTDSIFSKAFTPKEITEINHELESLSKEPSDTYHQTSDSITLSNSQHKNTQTSKHSFKEDQTSSIVTTTKDYDWINKFDPQEATRTLDEVTTQDSTFGTRDKKESETRIEPQKGIKNIERIIENRKSLFSTSKRLPPTSAVIRRRLQPQKQKNLTGTQETFVDNTIPTTNPINLKTGQNSCTTVECVLNRTSILSNNVIPSSLIPSGFPTMPEVLSTAELIQKTSNHYSKEKENVSIYSEPTDEEIQNNASSDIIIITPSTLVRSQNIGGNILIKKENSESERRNRPENDKTHFYTQTHTRTSISTTKEEIKPTETSTLSLVEEKILEFTSTPKPEAVTELHSFTQDMQSEQSTEVTGIQSNDTEKLTLDGVDVSNIDDEILELIMDEMGKARVKRILELRNMTLSELIAHRERGAGHFSDFSNDNILKNNTKEEAKSLSLEMRDTSGSIEENFDEEKADEEKTEKMIVEKAMQFLQELKKSDEVVTGVMKISQKEKFGDKLKPIGTVIPFPVIEASHVTAIQFPEDGILGAFPKYMYDIAGKRSKANTPTPNEKPSLYKEHINKPKEIQQFNDKREPRVFESMPKFGSDASSQDDLELFPYPDWRIVASKSSLEKTTGFPGISKEIMLVATSKSTSNSANIEDVVLLDEGEEVHHLRNHILGGKINIESGDSTDEDYPEPKRVPASVKSAIAASGALLGLAIFGFLAVLVSCKIRQRRARLRARQDILCEHLAEDFRSSQRSRTPVLRKSPFNNGIHSNTASNRNYYLWRTLRKTFQYE